MSYNKQNTDSTEPEVEIFERRTDFLWQWVAIYAVALIVYAAIQGVYDYHSVRLLLHDPVIIFLAGFIVGSIIYLLYHYFKKIRIAVGPGFFEIRTRFKRKKFTLSEIQTIWIGKEKFIKFRGVYRVIKIRIASRRTNIRIRPSSFYEEEKFVDSMKRLRASAKETSAE